MAAFELWAVSTRGGMQASRCGLRSERARQKPKQSVISTDSRTQRYLPRSVGSEMEAKVRTTLPR